jgi:hypothetical protein
MMALIASGHETGDTSRASHAHRDDRTGAAADPDEVGKDGLSRVAGMGLTSTDVNCHNQSPARRLPGGRGLWP